MVRKCIISLLTIAFIVTNIQAQTEYKKFIWNNNDEYMLKVSLSGSNTVFTIYGSDTSQTFTFDYKDILLKDNKIYINNIPVLDKNGFLLNDESIPFDLIKKTEIKQEKTGSQIYFVKRSTKKKFYSKKENQISYLEEKQITSGQFIRGSVISLWADIKIDGEVNEDVIAIFGNIVLSDKAVVRGDVVSVNGSVEFEKNTTVYGEVMSLNPDGQSKFAKKHRLWRKGNFYSLYWNFIYNRVDGATPFLGFNLFREDTLTPYILLYGGYGFASKELRYHLGIDHSFSIPRKLTVGGSVYKKLASNDDWNILQYENTITALIAAEDYRDYYEAQGGSVFAGYEPLNNMYLEIGMSSEKHYWVDEHSELWSLFGRSDGFRLNYSTIPDGQRLQLIEEFDKKNIVSLNGYTEYDTKIAIGDWKKSFWRNRLRVEFVPGGLNDDFNYTRLIISFSRQQKINRHLILYCQTTWGASQNELPRYRKFFLGGAGSLLGYDHAEYYGNDFWFGDLELGLVPFKKDFGLWLLYTAGTIADDNEKLFKTELKQSLGIGISLKRDIIFCFAKSLDRSDSPIRFGIKIGLEF
jgi:hypothetical protein